MSARSSVEKFQQHLHDLEVQGRYRSLSLPHGIDLTSNDYLSLANHPLLRQAAKDYLHNGGVIGAGGSRLLRGHCAEHEALEAYAATFFAAPRCLYLSSGFQANITIFQALASRHDVIIYDEFVHASAREGIQNSHAKAYKVQHNDASAFEEMCKKAQQNIAQGSGGHIWIAVESLYSMDGDIAPLEALRAVAERYDATLIIDEAHASGAMGATGRGVSEALIKAHGYDRIITLHTCGKALGVAGSILCASQHVIDTIINVGRGFVYSTAPMPLQAHLVECALRIIDSDEGKERRERLYSVAKKAQQIFGGVGSYIVPLVIGNDQLCVDVAHMLQQKGWDIRAIRPPTVPVGSARLRLSLNADLTSDMLDQFAADYFEVNPS
ncbi:MAG: aminotransferase class I/II-fold pyridoxal phosphate-dependent enzyme [Bdellovibrionales bacterium]